MRKLFDTITGGGLSWHESTSPEGSFDEAMLHRREGAFGLHPRPAINFRTPLQRKNYTSHAFSF